MDLIVLALRFVALQLLCIEWYLCRLPRLLTQQGLTTIERVNNAVTVGIPDFIGDKPILSKKKCELVTLILRKSKTATSHVEVQK